MEVTIRIPTPAAILRCGRWPLLAALVVALALALPEADHASATAGNSVNAPDTAGSVGWYGSLTLDASGNPVVSYFDLGAADLKVLHCNDADCAGGDESIASPDTTGAVGLYTSISLDALGNPVVSYASSSTGDLKLLHCDDPNCAGTGETMSEPDTSGEIAQFTSLTLDASGNPVVSYFDDANDNLKVLHCDDPNCSGTGDTATAPDTLGDVGRYASIALDASGNPVVSYADSTNGDLKVLHCNDPNCAGAGESIAAPDTAGGVGTWTSLTLDGAGYPVVGYHDDTNSDLKVLHCDDPNCVGGGESITSPDTRGSIGQHTSLTLDAAGNPVVSYYDATGGDLKVMRCNDPNCVGGNESLAAPDTSGVVGQYTSLALDGAGKPVVSHFDFIAGDLKLVHCGGLACTGLKGPGQISISSIGQYALPKTCFQVRDQAQNPLFTVCDNDFQAAPVSHPACNNGTDTVCNDEDVAAGGISVTTVAGLYSVSETKPAFNHTPDPAVRPCKAFESSTCNVTFVNAPNNDPWFPWDIDGNGAVDLFIDIFGVAFHFGDTKP
ncbi:MAG: hypothetical protein U1B78_05105 [Dehalococcoidia bacterium]|nr:hypothetical protein [Dehalococcoidia bacterium]